MNVREKERVRRKGYLDEGIQRIDVVLVFLLLTLKIFHTFFSVSIVDFEQVNVSWVYCGVRQMPIGVE